MNGASTITLSQRIIACCQFAQSAESPGEREAYLFELAGLRGDPPPRGVHNNRVWTRYRWGVEDRRALLALSNAAIRTGGGEVGVFH